MGLRMKNFNIMQVQWKNQFLGKGFMKIQYVKGEGCIQRGAWTVKEEAWRKKGGGVFEEKDGSWYPNAHYGDTAKK